MSRQPSYLVGDYPGGIRVRWSPVNQAYFVLWGAPAKPDHECALLACRTYHADAVDALDDLDLSPADRIR